MSHLPQEALHRSRPVHSLHAGKSSESCHLSSFSTDQLCAGNVGAFAKLWVVQIQLANPVINAKGSVQWMMNKIISTYFTVKLTVSVSVLLDFVYFLIFLLPCSLLGIFNQCDFSQSDWINMVSVYLLCTTVLLVLQYYCCSVSWGVWCHFPALMC